MLTVIICDRFFLRQYDINGSAPMHYTIVKMISVIVMYHDRFRIKIWWIWCSLSHPSAIVKLPWNANCEKCQLVLLRSLIWHTFGLRVPKSILKFKRLKHTTQMRRHNTNYKVPFSQTNTSECVPGMRLKFEIKKFMNCT